MVDRLKMTRHEGFMRRKHPAIHHPCDGCGKPFLVHPTEGWKGVKIVTLVEEISWFRGDDEVKFYHPECEPKS